MEAILGSGNEPNGGILRFLLHIAWEKRESLDDDGSGPSGAACMRAVCIRLCSILMVTHRFSISRSGGSL